MVANNYFQFKQFTIQQDRCAMKVTTDACLFGAFASRELGVGSQELTAMRVLDIGSGTGLLALMLAQKNANALIDAIEIDKDAFEQARENIAASPWANQIKIIHADARSFSFPQQYDVIISNPPFYENELKSDNKKKNIAQHSDDLPLQDVFSVIAQNLDHNGVFYLLLPYKRYPEIKDWPGGSGLYLYEILLFRQSANHSYFRFIIKGGKARGDVRDIMINDIAIKDEKDEYTEDFKELLKDYYLHL